MPLDDTGWCATWRLQGKREIAPMPDEFAARQFGQLCIMLTDVDDVHGLPPIGPIDIQLAAAA